MFVCCLQFFFFFAMTAVEMLFLFDVLSAQRLDQIQLNLTGDFIVSWRQPLNLKKLNDGKVNVALEGIIISFTLHSDSRCNIGLWSTERHDVLNFRATEQLVQLTERDPRETERERERERERECCGGRGGEVGINPFWPENSRKDFGFNDL